MSGYSGQITPQSYTVEMSNASAGIQRIHSSPQQQQQTHMVQSAQMLPQQQMMMHVNQPVHIPPCTSMQVQMASMVPPQMMSQQNMTLVSQQSQMQQTGNAQSAMMQVQHQMIAAGQMSPQQMQTQIVVTSMGQQQQHQMLSTMGSQVQHQLGPPTGTPHMVPQPPPPPPMPQQHPHLPRAQQPQQQQHQVMSSAQILQQQSQAQHSLNAQQGFAHPSVHTSNSNYQQTSPLRPTMARYPTPSPENMQHGTPIYRSPMQQRTASTPRVTGQTLAIRQALGHLPPTASPLLVNPVAEQYRSVPSNMKLIDKDAMEALIKTVDPLEAVEDDVSEALLQLVEEFVDDVVEQTARVAKHRNAQRVEAKDVQYVLEKRFKIFLPPSSTLGGQIGDHNPYVKSPTTEAHRQRMSLIKKADSPEV